MTDETDKRLAAVESDVRMVNDSVRRLCEEAERDREERKERDEKLDSILHGKDNESPGLLIEMDRVKGFVKRVRSHVNWLWGFVSALIITIVGSAVTAAINLFGGGKP